MKKIIFLFFCIFSFAFYFLCKSFNFLDFSLKDSELSPLSCNLNIKDCEYNFNDQKIKISLNPRPIRSLENIRLNVENLNYNTNLKIKIYGLNMYMGDIIYDLIQNKEKVYYGNIILNSSLLNTMRFRAEIFENDKYTGFYFDFDVVNNI